MKKKRKADTNLLKLGKPYLFKNSEGRNIEVTLNKTDKINDYKINFIEKNPDGRPYKGYIEYHLDRATSEYWIHGVLASPEGQGLGSLLIYLAAKQAQADPTHDLTLRSLGTAPTANHFYKKMGFTEDPNMEIETFRFLADNKIDIIEVTSTMELIAKPQDCIAIYEGNPKWVREVPAISPKQHKNITQFFQQKEKPDLRTDAIQPRETPKKHK